ANPGGGEAPRAAGEPGAACRAGLRGPALDRHGNASAPGHSRRESADGTRAPPRQLSARIPARLERKSYYTQFRIEPLAPEGAAALLEALVGADHSLEPVKRLLIERTEGNPFFLEESVRTLVEAGVLTGERGSLWLAKSLATIQVPATVQAVLASRIDRLP